MQDKEGFNPNSSLEAEQRMSGLLFLSHNVSAGLRNYVYHVLLRWGKLPAELVQQIVNMTYWNVLSTLYVFLQVVS